MASSSSLVTFSGIAPAGAWGKVSESSRLYDVFINHRGPDVKDTLATQLYNSLQQLGIRAFLDSKEIELGDLFPSTVEKAIRSAVVHIAIFSRRYAESAWCLEELVLMLKSKARIIPVFYEVKPSELRHIENGVYGDAFTNHKKKGRNLEKLKVWKEALEYVSFITGEEFNGFSDCQKLLSKVQKEVQRSKSKLYIAKYPVGLKDLVHDFEKECLDNFQSGCWINENGKTKARIAGIFGMGGVGKTTLAKELFNRKQLQYSRACFLYDVREVCAKTGLPSLQMKLVKDIFHENPDNFQNIEEGMSFIRHCIDRGSDLSFLVVLDDIDHIKQIDALLISDMLIKSENSLVIVTTRDVAVLNNTGITTRYYLRRMNKDDAKQLFCWHAFGKPHPTAGYMALVEDFLEGCEGLPLSLEVLGTHVHGRDNNFWSLELNKVSKTLPQDIHQRLKISFDGLDDDEKQIFMDIACFFIDQKKSMALRIWEGSGWSGQHALQRLQDKCLLNVECNDRCDDDVLTMHDHLRGREMANNLRHPHRVWHPQDIRYLELKGFRAILSKSNWRCFGWINNERSMDARITYFIGNSDDKDHTCPSLLWLELDFYGRAHTHIPLWIPLQNLQCLIIYNGNLKRLWQSDVQEPIRLKYLLRNRINPTLILKSHILERLCQSDVQEALVVSCLEELELSSSKELEEPSSSKELEEPPSLEELEEVSSLEELEEPSSSEELEEVSSLEELEEPPSSEELEEVSSLEELEEPSSSKELEVSSLEELEELSSSDKLEESFKDPSSLEDLEKPSSLKQLEIYHTILKEFPNLSGMSNHLENVVLEGQELPIEWWSFLGSLKINSWSLGYKWHNMHSLAFFESSSSSVLLPGFIFRGVVALNNRDQSPMCTSPMNSLQKVHIIHQEFVTKVLISGYHYPNIQSLYLSYMENLAEVNLEIVTTLKSLALRYCQNLETVSGLCELTNLMELEIGGCSEFEDLPRLSDLSCLKKVRFFSCEKLNRLELDDCANLKTVDVSDLPELAIISIRHCHELDILHLSNCTNLKSVSGICDLTNLVELKISGCSELEGLPSLSHLSRLDRVSIGDCEKLNCGNLKIVDVCDLPKLVIFSIRHSSELEELLQWITIVNCWKPAKVIIKECEELEELSVAGLNFLETLSIQRCPKLEKLYSLAGLSFLHTIQIQRCEKLQNIAGIEVLPALECMKISLCNNETVRNVIHRLQRVPSEYLITTGSAVNGAKAMISPHLFSDCISEEDIIQLDGLENVAPLELLETMPDGGSLGAIIFCAVVAVHSLSSTECTNVVLRQTWSGGSRLLSLSAVYMDIGEWIFTTVITDQEVINQEIAKFQRFLFTIGFDRLHETPSCIAGEATMEKLYMVMVKKGEEWKTLNVMKTISEQLLKK